MAEKTVVERIAIAKAAVDSARTKRARAEAAQELAEQELGRQTTELAEKFGLTPDQIDAELDRCRDLLLTELADVEETLRTLA